ncbi:hypothetical protein baBA2_000965 (plasmid) [Borrelia anserina]|uniref:Protein BptA n=2 Tax=Borrelia anserina TaxID=143 RepID=W5SP64_BORAN|nr:hypothetical protein [Borrelia anserina]AHH08964.1 hypothetical protein BAN_0002300 [Borrelia anserina BA2]APR65371.1 hypothetical protein N187_A52 [Borrelia anserina Es]UPA07335.1 hypothetical protein baBA2_000965 [Borrelia anserina]
MGKIKSLIFKIYVFVLTCFFIFFIFFFILFLRGDIFNSLFGVKTRYGLNEYDSVIGKRTYAEDFSSGNIKHIFFKALYVNKHSKKFEALQDKEKREFFDSYPSFILCLELVDNGRLMSFKDVIFDGVDASFYNQKITNSEFNSLDIPYFQIDGSNDFNEQYLGEYSVRVVNKVTLKLNETLFRALREQVKFKITLVSNDDVEYSVETENFLSKSHFNILNRN